MAVQPSDEEPEQRVRELESIQGNEVSDVCDRELPGPNIMICKTFFFSYD